MNPKTYLYILGAGASAPDDIPVTSEVVDTAFMNFGGPFDKAGWADELIGPWEKDIAIKIFKPVFNLFDNFYKTTLSKHLAIYYKEGLSPGPLNISSNTIEGFFTRLYYMKNGTNLYGVDLSPDEISLLYKNTQFFFFHPICDAHINTSAENYLRFINKALTREGRHYIVSFNYDLALEHAFYLKRKEGEWNLPNNLMWTYGMDFASLKNSDRYRFPEEKNAHIFYFKLHGSFNFGYCPVDKKVSLYSLFADAYLYHRFYNEEYLCHHDSHKAKSVLIPPVKIKEIDIIQIQELWDKASKALLEADEIYILGYSLPEADKEAQNLLKNADFNRLETIVIANPNKDHIAKLIKMLALPLNKTKIYEDFETYIRVI